MKKLSSLTIAFLLGITLLFSQDTLKRKYFIPKGAFVATGSLNFNFSKSASLSPYQANNFNLSLQESNGYFITNNFAMGLSVAYTFAYRKNVQPNVFPDAPTITKRFSNIIAPGIFMRYYKMFNSKFGFFGQLNAHCPVGFDRSISTDYINNSRDKSVGVNINIAPMLVYFITPKLSIEGGFGSVNYSYYKDLNSGNAFHEGGLSFNPNLQFGLSLYFCKTVQSKAK